MAKNAKQFIAIYCTLLHFMGRIAATNAMTVLKENKCCQYRRL